MSDTTLVSESGSQAAASAANPKTIALLLDTKCTVRVVFGRAWMPLGKLLKVTKGSVIELEGTIHRPAEIFVKDCLVGRGEVVIVNGNYAIRIAEIVSQTERIRASQVEAS